MDSMKGKRVIVTGPTSGVGKEIALQLAELGAEVILVCRDTKRGKAVGTEMSRWLKDNGPSTEKALMTWELPPSLGNL